MFEALQRVQYISDVSLSADGTLIAYSQRELDAETIWWFAVDHPEPRSLGPGSRPRWSTVSNVLAFLRPTGTRFRIAIVRNLDAEPVLLPPEARFTSAPHWAPSDDRIALVGINDHDLPTQLFVLDVATAALQQVTHAIAPSFAPAWSPDGSRLAFSRGTIDGRPGDCDVWTVDLRTASEMQVTRGLRCATSPSWAPDGEHLACFGGGDPAAGEDHCTGVYRIDVSTGGWQRLGGDDPAAVLAKQHATTAAPIWTSNGRVLARVSHRGNIQLASFSLAGDTQRFDVHDRQVLAFDARGDRVAMAVVEKWDPAVICWLDGVGAEQRLPTRNTELQEALSTNELELVARRFRVGLTELDAWLLRPRGERGRLRRLAIALHGGPHAYSSACFAPAHLFRYVLAARGWCVLTINHTGSGSYGRDFAEALHGKWGQVDLSEILAVAQELVDAGEVEDRWAIIGYSYGGFLSAWAVTHCDRFAAAVVGAPIANFETFVRTSDIGPWYVPRQLGSLDEVTLRQRSPVNVTHASRTPTLLLHGEADLRCPIGQSEELYAALVASGTPVEFVRFPGADHDLPGGGLPSQRIDYHRRIVDWLERHVPA